VHSSRAGAARPDRPVGARERAVVVGVDFTVRSAKLRSERAAARLAASRAQDGPDVGDKAQVERAGFLPALGARESLEEFRELVASAGGEIAAQLLQRRPRPDPATLLGAGKVEEIAGVAASTRADLVLFDHDLSPTQLRNLEAALPCRVLDRTQLILDIFAPPDRPRQEHVAAWRRHRHTRTR
jgi:GTPase